MLFVKKSTYDKLEEERYMMKKQYEAHIEDLRRDMENLHEDFAETLNEKRKLESENKQLKAERDNYFTLKDLNILDARLDYYDTKIDECRGVYTDKYVDLLLLRRDECAEIMTLLFDIYHDKKNENDTKEKIKKTFKDAIDTVYHAKLK